MTGPRLNAWWTLPKIASSMAMVTNAETPYHPDILKLLDEFADVFPDNLHLGLPVPLEIDHSIDLVEHAKPPAQRVYRLSPRKRPNSRDSWRLISRLARLNRRAAFSELVCCLPARRTVAYAFASTTAHSTISPSRTSASTSCWTIWQARNISPRWASSKVTTKFA